MIDVQAYVKFNDSRATRDNWDIDYTLYRSDRDGRERARPLTEPVIRADCKGLAGEDSGS